MQAVIHDAIFVSESNRSFTNRETGEVRQYVKGLFSQDGSEPLEVNLDESLAGSFEKFQTYNLVLQISSWSKGISFKVIDVA